MRILYRLAFSLFILSELFNLAGCASLRKAAMSYDEAKLPQAQIKKDISYWQAKEADPYKNRLDLFLPAGKNWPVLVFVHGGSWTTGDKSLEVLGADVYGNIGRYFALQGIGVAVISYRLMPEVDWQSQTMDVARATAWVYQHIQEYGGNPKNLFLAGHSAGAQLITRISLDPKWLAALDLTPKIIAGVVAVSGAGYDLTDEETYALAQKQGIFEDLFSAGSIPLALRKKLSPIKSVRPGAPPFLVVYAKMDKEELQNESQRLYERLKAVGDKSQLVPVAGEGHMTIVTALSSPSKVPTAVIQVFVQTLSYF